MEYTYRQPTEFFNSESSSKARCKTRTEPKIWSLEAPFISAPAKEGVLKTLPLEHSWLSLRGYMRCRVVSLKGFTVTIESGPVLVEGMKSLANWGVQRLGEGRDEIGI